VRDGQFHPDKWRTRRKSGFADETDEGEDYESISMEEPTLISSFLLGVDIDDPDTYGAPMQEWLLAMAQGNVSSLAEQLQHHHAGTEEADALLAGLDPELVKLAACTWIANQEYLPPGEKKLGGWYADLLDLKYRPMSHADSVVKRWIEYSLKSAREAEGTEHEERAYQMRDTFLSVKRGVGRCMKCHTVDGSGAAGNWTYLEITIVKGGCYSQNRTGIHEGIRQFHMSY